MLWLSAQEIANAAAAGLMPDLPTTERTVRRLATREHWAECNNARIRQGRSGGGGLEYHIDLLPVPSRTTWLAHHLNIDASDLRPPLTDAPVSNSADARAVLLRLAEGFKATNKLPQTAADGLFCEIFNAGSIEFPEWLKATITSLSSRTLARWRKAVAEGAQVARCGRPRGSGILDRAADGTVRDLIIAAIANQPFLKAKHLRALVRDRFGADLSITDAKTGEVRDMPLPTVRMFQFALKSWRKEYHNELMRLTDPDGYRSKIEFTATGSTKCERLNELWQVDASPADVMLTTGRHSIYMAIDIYSRRTVVLVSKTPRASAVGLLTRKCLMKWGVPERIKTDNGSDFVARQTKRLLGALGIEIELSPPYEPRTKGNVERVIGTFQRDLATCPGFIGHSVADRKIIENRKAFSKRLGASDTELFGVEMDMGEFQDWCDAWCDKIYGHDSHAGLGGRTPFEAAAAYGGTVRMIEHEAALDVLLAPIASGDGIRRVGKQGVRVDGAHYLPFGVMPGTDVLVRMDPADLGRIMLFDPANDSYLGEAICPDLAGMSPIEVTAKARAMQRDYEQERMVDFRRSMRALKPRDVANALRRDGERRADVMVAFPQKTEGYSNAAIEAASEASGKPVAHIPKKPVDPAAHAAFIAEFKPKLKAKLPQETPRERFQRALGLEDKIQAGDRVNDADAAWLQVYRTQPEFKAQQMMFEEYGAQMFAG